MGTTELKEFVAFGLSAGELLSGLQDGFGFDDVAKVIATAKLAGPALKNAGVALDEYVSMSDEEASELESYVVSEFDISDDKVEEGIETALKVCIELHSLVGLFVKPKVKPV